MRRMIGHFVANSDPATKTPSYSSWEWSIELPGSVRPEHARIAYREYLERYATADSYIANAELIFGELVANVVRHALGSASFEVDWHGRYPRLLVLDRGPGFRNWTQPDPSAESGRGLMIVQALALEMEYGNRPDGGAFVHVTLPVERPQHQFPH